jgi:hypothetical protein
MEDLIYGGNKYKAELKKLFPKCKIEDASDEIHTDRISISVKNIADSEYYRIIILNGFFEMSLSAQLVDKSGLAKLIEEWKTKYPEYFRRKGNEKQN